MIAAQRWVIATVAVVLFLGGCANSALPPFATPISVPAAPAVGLARPALDYLEEINRSVARATRDSDGGATASSAFAIALKAASQFDLANRSRFLAQWNSTQRILDEHARRADVDGLEQLKQWYWANPAEERALQRHLVDEFFAQGILINLALSARDPVLMIPLAARTLDPEPAVHQLVSEMLKVRVSAQSVTMFVVDEPDLASLSFAGMTVGATAVINAPRCHALAAGFGVDVPRVRSVVMANELVHVLLEHRDGPEHLRDWPLEALTQVLGVSFTPGVIQVEEFLSDAASIAVDPVGIFLAYNNLFDGSVTTGAAGQGVGNSQSVYGVASEVFLKVFERAESMAAVPESRRQGAVLRQIAARADYDLAQEYLDARPREELVPHIRQAYREMSQRVLDLLDSKYHD